MTQKKCYYSNAPKMFNFVSSLADVASKLNLESPRDAEYIIAKVNHNLCFEERFLFLFSCVFLVISDHT